MRPSTDQIVVVTGGAKGIGAACVDSFCGQGASVALLDIDESICADLADRFGGRAVFIRCDVSREVEVKSAMLKTYDRFGGIDCLVNNAGIQRYSSVTETTEEEWDLVMGVNLKSAFLCAKHAIPHMQARGGGVIVNVSSIQAFLSQNNVAPYTTSKTALLGLTRSIAVDYGPSIRCVAVCPGTVDTPMLRNAIKESHDPEAVLEECNDMHILKRIANPKEIAELIVYVCGDKSPFMTGTAIRIDGGLGIAIRGSKRTE